MCSANTDILHHIWFHWFIEKLRFVNEAGRKLACLRSRDDIENPIAANVRSHIATPATILCRAYDLQSWVREITGACDATARSVVKERDRNSGGICAWTAHSWEQTLTPQNNFREISSDITSLPADHKQTAHSETYVCVCLFQYWQASEQSQQRADSSLIAQHRSKTWAKLMKSGVMN